MDQFVYCWRAVAFTHDSFVWFAHVYAKAYRAIFLGWRHNWGYPWSWLPKYMFDDVLLFKAFELRFERCTAVGDCLGFHCFVHMKFDLGIFQLPYVMEKSRIFLPALVFVCCSVYNVNKLELGFRLVAKQRTMIALRDQESASLYQRCCFHCKNAFTKYVYWGILTISMYL